MGLAKYYEDDYRIYCDRLYSNGLAEIGKYKLLLEEHRCPYCRELFSNRDEMFSHIRSAHNITEPLLFINGIVVKSKDTIYVSDVQSARIQMYGFRKDVSINGKEINEFAEDDSLDITEYVNKIVGRNLICSIQIGSNCSQIERYSLYSVNQDMLSKYIADWENNLRTGKAFKPFNVDQRETNAAETYYLKGIYNYFVACQAKGSDKKDRYYEAYSILKQFIPTNSLGLFIQKIIAFRFNWIKTLNQLCKSYRTNDDFLSAYSFFAKEIPNNPTKSLSELRSLYIEDDLLEILNAILAFNNNDFDQVNAYLRSHENIETLDSNLKDKILLLKYRMAAKEGRADEAEYFYNEIQAEDFKT